MLLQLQHRQGSLSLRAYAHKLKVSAAYLSDVYNGKRDPGKKLLKPLGLEAVRTKTIEYRTVGKGD